MALNKIDMDIIDILSGEPGTRQTRRNLAYILDERGYGDDSKPEDDRINRLSSRVGSRIDNVLLAERYVDRVGPAPRSGLYELADPKGMIAAQEVDDHDIRVESERLRVRADIQEKLES